MMTAPPLPDGWLEAGADYLRDLRRLGMFPNLLSWAYDVEEEGFAFLLVWSGVERFGPLELMKLLFKAYNTAVLPRAIDPLLIHVFSPKQLLGDALLTMKHMLSSNSEIGIVLDADLPAEGDNLQRRFVTQPEWVYVQTRHDRSFDRTRADWQRFKRKIEALAA